MRLDARQQLVLSLAARDHVTITEHPQKVIVAAPRSAPAAVATTAVSGGAVAAVATAARAQVAIATSPDAGQQLVLSPAAGDHVATVARLKKVDVAALRSLDAIAMNAASEGYRRSQSPQRSQLRGGCARPAAPARQQGGSSKSRVGRMTEGDTVAMGTFTARKSATGTSTTRNEGRQEGQPQEQAQDGRPSTATGAGGNVSRGRTLPGLCGGSICTLCNFKHRTE